MAATCGVLPVVHEQQLELLHVVDNELHKACMGQFHKFTARNEQRIQARSSQLYTKIGKSSLFECVMNNRHTL
jgi:hypothetical protein